MAEPAILALDLGGTKLAAALFSPGGAIRQRATYALDGRQAEGKQDGRRGTVRS